MEFCPGDPDLLMVLEPSTGLILSSFNPIDKANTPILSLRNSHLSCFEWSPRLSDRLVATGTDAGIVHVVECRTGNGADQVPRCHAVASLAARTPPRGLCNAVAWSNSSEKIASGWEKDGSQRENGVVVWDVASGVNLSTSEFSASVEERLVAPGAAIKSTAGGIYGESVLALTWLPGQENLLACGSTKWLRVWDVRTPSDTAQRVMAHQKGVRGIQFDPERPTIVATFSDGLLEPVNIWDLRKLEQSSSPEPWAVLRPCSKSNPSPVTQVAWCPDSTSTLATISADMNHISLWDVAPGRPLQVPSQVHGTPHSPRAIAWRSNGQIAALMNEPESELFIAETRSTALAVSKLGALAASSHGSPAPQFADAAAAIEEDDEEDSANDDDDVEGMVVSGTVIRGRALAGYSLDVGRNLQVLSDELDLVTHAGARRDLSRLTAVWNWVGRIEQDKSSDSLSSCGVVTLLEDEESVIAIADAALKCPVFVTSGRRAVLAACGWAVYKEGIDDDEDDDEHEAVASDHNPLVDPAALEQVLMEVEGSGDFERAAALAVWSGDLRAALGALTRAAELSSSADNSESNKTSASPLLQLVSMCVAGYPGSGAANMLWQDMCRSLIGAQTEGHAYLGAIAAFLLFASSDQYYEGSLWYADVLEMDGLSLEDKTAFASRFLPPAQLESFLRTTCGLQFEQGNLEGLLLLGLTPDGSSLLQSYLDKSADLQTVALLSCRVRDAAGPGTSVFAAWVEDYRDLLDAWQLWESRALLDVGAAQLRRGTSTERSALAASGPDGAEELGDHICPGLFVRCNFCNGPLPLARLCRQRGLQNKSWLQNQKPVLSCCPSCRNSLPRCYVCQLSLSSINPSSEVRARLSADGGLGRVNLERLTTLQFGNWFSWCVQCKHGGHADHIAQWFTKHSTCGVSGCECQCGFS